MKIRKQSYIECFDSDGTLLASFRADDVAGTTFFDSLSRTDRNDIGVELFEGLRMNAIAYLATH